MARKPIITNPIMKHPVWSGCKLVLVLFFPPMFLGIEPDFFYKVYLPFIVPIFYSIEIVCLILICIGKGHLVDNSSPNIQFIPFPYINYPFSSSNHNTLDDDIVHNHDHSHRH